MARVVGAGGRAADAGGSGRSRLGGKSLLASVVPTVLQQYLRVFAL